MDPAHPKSSLSSTSNISNADSSCENSLVQCVDSSTTVRLRPIPTTSIASRTLTTAFPSASRVGQVEERPLPPFYPDSDYPGATGNRGGDGVWGASKILIVAFIAISLVLISLLAYIIYRMCRKNSKQVYVDQDVQVEYGGGRRRAEVVAMRDEEAERQVYGKRKHWTDSIKLGAWNSKKKEAEANANTNGPRDREWGHDENFY